MPNLRPVPFVILGLMPVAAEPTAEGLAFFEKEIRPVLVESCYKCHSTDSKKLKAGLYVDSREGMLTGGDSGPAIVAGDPDASLLIETIRYTNVDMQMPPKSRLDAKTVSNFEKWVTMGAPWPEEDSKSAGAKEKGFNLEKRRNEHWCWQAVTEQEPPAVQNEKWAQSPIDRFILSRLEKEGIQPASPADRRTWIRRVTFDLIGLPPKPGEVEAFVADESPDAFEKVVDRLLATPEYGEKWARHWMDLVRYAESYGHEFDYNMPESWKYRDYLVRAFNDDVSHRQMVAESIAGDLLENPRRRPDGANESVVGTGFWYLGEAVHSPTDVRGDEAERIDNMVDVFGKSFLGLTISCARCHDHKFDAISIKDYYSLTGYLQSTRRDLGMVDPNGKIKAARTEIANLQRQASKELGAGGTKSNRTEREGVIADFDSGMPEGWTRHGAAFPDAPGSFEQREVSFLDPGKPLLPGGVIDSGIYGNKFHGVLRSPTFKLEGPEIHVRMASQGDVEMRVVIDGYFMGTFNGLLFKGTFHRGGGMHTDGSFQWKTFGGDLRKYVGHNVYLEFTDRGDGYIAIDEIAYKRSDTPAPKREGIEPNERFEKIAQRAREIGASVPRPEYYLGVADGSAEDDHVHIRGGHKNLGDLVPRRFLTALGGENHPPSKTGSGRLNLARQVVDPANPLTARVQVNRLWHHLTGRGLVGTVDDFGVMGEEPTHPKLLDWLAAEFVRLGWSNKKMIRTIVLSNTYRMSCVTHPENASPVIAEKDAGNLLLHKFRVRRMPSESIRDGILAVSGRLDLKKGGGSVPVHLTSFMEGRGRPRGGPLDGAGRRSIYTAIRRNFLPPFHLAFDMPIPFNTIGRRSSSNVPAQSLALMNDPFVIEQAKRWAGELEKEPDLEKRLIRAYLEAYSRQPEPEELVKASHFLERQAELYGVDPKHRKVWDDFCHVLFNKKEFIYLK